jgi:hypothetical protein
LNVHSLIHLERRRDQRGLPWLEDVIQDVRYGVRTLRRAPVFTVLTIATLTLAIGANTAIFSLVDPLLFRDLPVRDPGSLVQFTWQYPGDPPLNLFTLEDCERYRAGNTVFSDMAASCHSERSRSQAASPSAPTWSRGTSSMRSACGLRWAACWMFPTIRRAVPPRRL